MSARAVLFFRYAGLAVALLAWAVGTYWYMHPDDKCVLYYYGASPEVPKGKAVAVLNPFRSRRDEALAQHLIRDLRTDNCREIATKDLNTDAEPLCSVLGRTTKEDLIWLDPPQYAGNWEKPRRLFYDLPESRARLVIYFHTDEIGWLISGASIVR